MKRSIFSLVILIALITSVFAPLASLNVFAAEETLTLTFDSTSKRTSFSASEQVWSENGITFTNKKASSTNSVADYANPVRLYASSSITVAAPGNILKIVFDCSSSSYATAMKNSIGNAATASSDKVTVTLDGTSKSLEVAKLTAQVRLDSISVTYSKDCQHTSTSTNKVDPTCTENGSETVICNTCGATLSNTVIPATGHNYVDGVCSCGDVREMYTCTFITPTGTSTETTYDSVTMPEGPAASDDKYTFVGWATTNIIATTEAPTIYSSEASVEITENTTFYAVYTYEEEGSGSGSYVKKDISAISSSDKVVITITNSSGTYAMTNANGTGSAPAAVKMAVTANEIQGDVASNLIWNIEKVNDGFIIHPNGSDTTWLYCTSTNNGTRVGTNSNNTFVVDPSTGYLKHIGTSRYIGVYNNADWRCYTSHTTANIANQTLAFYVLSSGSVTYYTTSPTAAECSHSSITKRIVNEPTCTENGLYSVVCNDCESVLPDEIIPAEHHTVDGICVRCGYTETPTETVDGNWTLVTDASTLKAGDMIIIVAKDYDFALGTTQNTNNRSQASVVRGDGTVTFGSNVQVIQLKAGSVEGSFALSVGDASYLYAASSGSNYLKTQDNVNGNASWIISIENGIATVIAQGSATRNTLRYNDTNSIFSCYDKANTQKDISIYRLESAINDDVVEIYGASMTVGATLAMHYYVFGCTGTDYYMTFTMNGTVSEPIRGENKNGYLVFSFENIPPQYMGDTITATVYKDGEELALDDAEISIKEYAEKVIAEYESNEKLMNLVADMLKYGAAAQKYREYNTDILVTDEIDLDGKGSTATPNDATDNARELILAESTGIDKTIYSFTVMGVRFDFDNKIYVKFKATGDSTVKLTCNGKTVTSRVEDLGDGVYVFYTDGITATEFGDIYTFNLYIDDVLHQTVKYSVNSYVCAKQSSDNAALSELVLALYRYGLSAKEYAGI